MEIRALGAEEMAGTRDIRSRAFGAISDEAWANRLRVAGPGVEAGRYLAGFDGGRVVATASVYDMTQWWRGRSVSMAGVSGVTVAPEERGRGVGRAMMTATLRRCAEFGHALSMLFPLTTPLYRSFGWEQAGAQHWTELPAEALRAVRADARVPVRRPTADDGAEVAAVIDRVHRTALDSGPVGLGTAHWRMVLEEESNYVHLAEDGFLSYHWADGNNVLKVDRLVAGSERTLRALWAIVGSGSSAARTVRACIGPQDPVLWLLRERSVEDVRRKQWMLRVVDAPAAIEARGYPPGITADVPLRVEDEHLPANAGSWRLTVRDGEGRLERSAEDPGALRLGARGLAALYAGVPGGTLLRSGLIEGGAAEADVLSGVFAASPFALDYF
ncbi:GNAT family N-acetyltransferase [Actinomadura xylanilytica]|uniref:GNAT family N-acetyltransferase n=1 Tax=Actinomadura xylanilytica TaxID=887459 RepID=UPI00255AAC98|nr:GNAT family N-acetyltransferase [Actinomadura xylanilytica]MDL4777288.1 GNAT family N-acetyltransferase [Actinomadura xylanilytica]